MLSRGDPEETPRSDGDHGETTLSTCPDCGTTYIGEVESCSNCGGAVEETPTERDLGLL